MKDNGIWKLVNRPLDKKEEKKLIIIDSKWVFTRKTGQIKWLEKLQIQISYQRLQRSPYL